MMKFLQKARVKAAAVFLLIAAMVMTATAEPPYQAYDYDWFWETYPVQSGYVVERTVTGADLGLDIPLRGPEDVFIYRPTGEIFICDTLNNRIIITNENFGNVRVLDTFYYRNDYRVENFVRNVDENGNISPEDEAAYWAEVAKIGTETTLRNPTGIFVTEFRGRIRVYIADNANERVIACDMDGGIWMEYRRPVGESTFSDTQSFRPEKVIADQAGNVFVCIKTITSGAVTFNENGIFTGYFGANRVNRGSDAWLNYILRYILPREVMKNRMQPVPVEFSNFTIDGMFIYTVTTTRSANLDILKKLNPAGENIFERQGYDDFVWGDFTAPYAYGKEYRSLIVDVAIDSKQDIYLLDRESGKVFQYDKEGHLMFIFGGKGAQKGLFTAPAALDTHKDKVFVLDSTKNSITVFSLTEFGGLVTEAMGLFNRGLYEESMQPWEEVLVRDANYYMAHIGMGNAKMSVGEFGAALDHFYQHSRAGYGRAFKDFRIQYVRDNFDSLVGIVLLSVFVIVGVVCIIKMRKKDKSAKQ